jgi:hypothetical protein
LSYLICPNCGLLSSERGSRLNSCIRCFNRLDRLVPLVRAEDRHRVLFDARLQREQRMRRLHDGPSQGDFPSAA